MRYSTYLTVDGVQVECDECGWHIELGVGEVDQKVTECIDHDETHRLAL